MVPSVVDKKYATDNRLFRDAVISDGVFKNFEDSPITAELKVSDVCTYAPGPLLINPALYPRLVNSFAINLTKGVLPVPPIEILPTTMMGLGEFHTLFGCFLYEFLLTFTSVENKKVSGVRIYNHKLLLYQASIR